MHIKRKNVFFDYKGLEYKTYARTHTECREGKRLATGVCLFKWLPIIFLSTGVPTIRLHINNAVMEGIDVIAPKKAVCKTSGRCGKLPIWSDSEQSTVYMHQLNKDHTLKSLPNEIAWSMAIPIACTILLLVLFGCGSSFRSATFLGKSNKLWDVGTETIVAHQFNCLSRMNKRTHM